MSFFSGYDFFVYLVIMLIPAIVLGLLGKSLKIYRYFISAVFIFLVYKSTPVQMGYLIGYVAFSICLVKLYLYLRTKYDRNVYIYRAAVVLAIAPLAIYKVCAVMGHSLFGFLGISYICFRTVQVIIETYDGVIKEVNALQFAQFLLFFTSLSSGPIDRSRRFNEDDEKVYTKEEYTQLLTTGVYKLVLGIFYKVACSGIFYNILTTKIAGHYSAPYMLAYAYVYGVYMFFDFAGYSAMAIGTSYILGIKMPENFNKPFLAVDIKDFWNRWHITLSSWFRDFIFTRFMVDSARKKRFKNRLTGAAVGLIINMGVMGVWHGLEAHYIVYGLYHGCVMALVEVYQKKSKFYKKHKNDKWYIACSWFINLNVVMLGFLIFSGYVNEAIGALKAASMQ